MHTSNALFRKGPYECETACLPVSVWCLQSIEGLAAELDDLRRQPSPLAAAQAAKQEVLADQRKFQEVIAGNQVRHSKLTPLGQFTSRIGTVVACATCACAMRGAIAANMPCAMYLGCCALSCCCVDVQAQRASLQKKLEERQADLEAKRAALVAVRAGEGQKPAGAEQHRARPYLLEVCRAWQQCLNKGVRACGCTLCNEPQ